MKNTRKSLPEKMEAIIRDFLEIQLGEIPEEIECFHNDHIYSIYAYAVISPAEKQLMESTSGEKMILDYKLQQFNSVKDELAGQLERLLGKAVSGIHCSLTNDGSRIISVYLKHATKYGE